MSAVALTHPSIATRAMLSFFDSLVVASSSWFSR